MTADLDSVLGPIRDAVEADGGRLRVTGRRDDVLTLVLEQPAEGCDRCVLPTETIEEMAVDLARELDPSIRSAEVTIVEST